MILAADLVRSVFAIRGLVTLVIVAAVWLALRDSRAARRLLYAVAVFYTIVTLHGVSTAGGRALAWGFHPFRASDLPAGSRTAIVVLGSSSKTVGDWWGENYSVVDRAGGQRVLEAAHVYRLIDADYVISSGGEPRPRSRREPAGRTMETALVALGVPREKILVETTSKTTHDEAVIVGPMLRRLPIDHVVLVTSQSHMRRALGTFRAVGIDCVPAIAAEADFGDEWWLQMVPTREGLDESNAVVHEVLGIPYYALRGWWKP